MLHEVPIRDFMAYDTGSYYRSVALISLWGDNYIMTLRGAVEVIQSMIFCRNIADRSSRKKTKFLIFSAIRRDVCGVDASPAKGD